MLNTLLISIALLCATEAHADGSAVKVAVYVSGIADVATTRRCLASNACREVNPVMRSIIGRPLMAYGSNVGLSYAVNRIDGRAGKWLRIGTILGRSALVINTFRVARRNK